MLAAGVAQVVDRPRGTRGQVRGSGTTPAPLPPSPVSIAHHLIAAWRDETGLANMRAPIVVDASAGMWPIEQADALLSINMVHISPWQAALGLIDGAARILPPGGPLILYGPWLLDEVATAPSNLAFDADLKRRDPSWGRRRVEEFAAAAGERWLELIETRAMPANNRMLLLRRSPVSR